MTIFTHIRRRTQGTLTVILFFGKLLSVFFLLIAAGANAQPALRVFGNTSIITNGDNSPSLLDNTDFGITSVNIGSVNRTFVIENQGTAPLQFNGLTGVEILGPDTADFSISVPPIVTVLNSGQSVSFTVVFNPTAMGVRIATVKISSNDPDDNPYQFTITGKGDFDMRECTDPCTGDDVTLSDVELHDEYGEPYPPALCGLPGQTVISTLFVTINNNTSANRRAFRLSCDVYVDGQDSGDDILACFDGPIPGNSSVTIAVGSLTYTFGSTVELRNVKIGWRTANSGDCQNSITCNDYPGGQCSLIAPEHDFVATTPLTSNFETIAVPLCSATLTTSFISTSTGGTPPYTYSWNFGDPSSGANNTSAVNDPVHTFVAAGVYTVSLIVTDSNGVQCPVSNPILVMEPTVAVAISGGVLTCASTTVTLQGTGSSTGFEYSYQWTSTDGNIVSGSNTLNPVVDQPGTYMLVVTNAFTGCTATASAVVVENTKVPVANAGPGMTLTCNQTQVILNGTASTGPTYSYAWTTGDGNILSGSNTLSPVIDAAGTYTLIVTNTLNGCTAQSTVDINVDQTPPVAVAGGNLILDCNQTAVKLDGTGSSTGPAISYQWTANPGNIVSGANTLNNVVVNTAGTYTLIVSNTANGCTAEAEVVVVDNTAVPMATIAPAQLLTCSTTSVALDAGNSTQGSTILYSWSSPDGNILSGNNTLSPQINAPGTYNLLVTDTGNGCTASASVTVDQDISAPTAVAAVPAMLSCLITKVQLNGTGSSTGSAFRYQWTTATGNITSGQATLSPTVNQAGSYTLIVTNLDNGCTAQTSISVTSNLAQPLANANAAQPITCATPQVTISGNGSSQGAQYSYVWSTSNGNILSGANTLNPTVNAAGTYLLTVINNQSGCTATATASLGSDLTPPLATVAPAGMLSCTLASLTLDGAGSSTGPSYSYSWSSSSGVILSGQGTLNPEIGAAGTYTLLVTNTTSGCTATASISVAADLSVPSANAGPPDTLNCLQNQVTLDGTASDQGNQFSYTWTGPGIVSGAGTLTPLVDQPGLYELLITNTANGCTASASVPVLADFAVPVADPGPAMALNCKYTTLTLDGSNSSTGSKFTYQWTASSGGTILSGANTLNPVINTSGTYTLIVTDTANGCTAIQSVDIGQDTVPPVVSIGTPGMITCINSTVTLLGIGSTGPAFKYQWTSSNGSIQSGANTLSPVVSAAGMYKLTVFNSTNGCAASDSVAVQKDDEVPLAVVAPPDALNCSISQVQLNGAGSSAGPDIQYSWTTSGGNILSGANSLNPVVDAPGQYMLAVHNAFNNCSAQFFVDVKQDLEPPVADAGPPAVLTCAVSVRTLDGSGSSQGHQFSYSWTAQTGQILNGANTLFPEVDHSGAYFLVVTNIQNGCTAEAAVQILLDQNTPEANAGSDMAITCISGTIALAGTGTSSGATLSYQWTASAGGNIVSGANTLSPVVDAPGVYTLVVTDTNNGCTDTDVAQVSLDQMPPAVTIASPGVLNCAVHQVTLNTSGSSSGSAYTYQWTSSGGGIFSGANGSAPVVNQPGTYNLLITNTGNGCTTTASVAVVQDIELPVVDAGAVGQLNCAVLTTALNGSVSNAGTNPQYNWTTTNGNIVSGANTLNPVVDAPGTYRFTVTNPDNHCTSSDQVPVLLDANPPVAVAAVGLPLTCTNQITSLLGAGSSAGSQFSYQWTAKSGGNILSGANTLSPAVDAPGVYLLTVTNLTNHCTATASATVVQNLTSPQAVTNSAGILNCIVSSLTLDGTGSSAGSQFVYEWFTPNGRLVSGDSTLTPVIDLPGAYTLVVTDSNNGCTSTASVQVTQNIDPPAAAATAPDELTCITTEVLLSGAGSSSGNNFNYQWSTSAGQILSGATTLEPAVGAPGVYQLLVTNTLNGCTATAVATVSQDIGAPTATASANGTITCTLSQLNIYGSGIGSGQGVSYAWTTVDGSFVAGMNSPNPLIDAGGVYTLVVTDLSNGCTNSATVTVPEDTAVPTAAIASPGMLTCLVTTVLLDATNSAQGSQFAYSWSGPGIMSGDTTLHLTVNKPGNYLFQVVDQSNGCMATTETSVAQDIQPPVADAGAGFELDCQTFDGYLDASGSSSGAGITYLWTTQNGNISAGETEATPLVDSAGVYQLLVTNTENGCTATDEVLVTENTNYPTGLQLAVTRPDCQGGPGKVQIDLVEGGSGPYLYSIDGGNTFHTTTLFENLGAGDYQLVVQDANGCQHTEALSLPKPSGLDVTLAPDVSLAFGESTKLVANLNIPFSQIDTIIWSPMEELTPTNLPHVVQVNTYLSQEFTVTVIDTAGCLDRATVFVKIEDPHLWAPNAISSNKQDGYNDVFLIFAAPKTVNIIHTLQIHDRWGNMVFRNENIQPNDEKLGWNGYFRGKPMNPAVFVWWAEVELVSGRRIIMKGDVTIVN